MSRELEKERLAVDERTDLKAAESKDQVPEDLNLLYFLEREELSDCSISLPASGASPAKEVNCHRLALCSTSGYCFRKFLVPDAPKILKLPELPDDAELRRQMPLQSLFQLVLRFAYCGQKWEPLKELVTPESFPGLYALAALQQDAQSLWWMTSVTAWASPQVVITTAVPSIPTLRVEVDSKAAEWHRRYHDLEASLYQVQAELSSVKERERSLITRNLELERQQSGCSAMEGALQDARKELSK
eukprot:s5744_g1.t1